MSKLAGPAQAGQRWEGRRHFFGAAAEAMRRILVENARRKARARQGGQAQRLDIGEVELACPLPDDDLLALHEALDQLATLDPPAAELIKLRFFAGLTHEQAADLLGLSRSAAEAARKDTPEARAACLDAACTGDADLRRQVEALMAAHERAGDFLEQSVVPQEGPPTGEGPGTVIGRYKLLEEIGEGGVGRVFIAEQQPVRRKVALKIIKVGMDKRVLTASADGTAGLWEARTGMPLSSPFKHANNVADADFSPDGRRGVTSCFDGSARIWPVVNVHSPSPRWRPELAEAVAGERLNADQTTADVPPAEFFRLRERLAPAPADDDYAQWVGWFLADRSTRAVAPGAVRSVPEFVGDLLVPWRLWLRPWDYPERFAQAARLAPTNSAAFAQRAYQMSLYQITNESRRLPTLAWLSDRALSLDPEQSMSWTAQALSLALAGQTNAAFAAFERGRPFASKDPLFWVAWGNLYEQSGRLEEAWQMFTNAATVAAKAWPLKKAKLIVDQSQGVLDRHQELRDKQLVTPVLHFDEPDCRIPDRDPKCPRQCVEFDLYESLDTA